METAIGIISHSQNTSRVSGGANNTAVSTTYIALFRLGQRQVEFSSGQPLPVTDGDQVVVAGREYQGTLYADAIRNVTTGVVTHSSIFGRVCGALLVLILGLAAAFALAKAFDLILAWVYLGFIAGAAYLFWRAFQTSNALQYVKSVVP